MAEQSHVVKAALIVVQVEGAQGGEAYLRRGRVVPSSVKADEIKRLLALGLIEKAPEPAKSEPAKAPAGDGK